MGSRPWARIATSAGVSRFVARVSTRGNMGQMVGFGSWVVAGPGSSAGRMPALLAGGPLHGSVATGSGRTILWPMAGQRYRGQELTNNALFADGEISRCSERMVADSEQWDESVGPGLLPISRLASADPRVRAPDFRSLP